MIETFRVTGWNDQFSDEMADALKDFFEENEDYRLVDIKYTTTYIPDKDGKDPFDNDNPEYNLLYSALIIVEK